MAPEVEVEVLREDFFDGHGTENGGDDEEMDPNPVKKEGFSEDEDEKEQRQKKKNARLVKKEDGAGTLGSLRRMKKMPPGSRSKEARVKKEEREDETPQTQKHYCVDLGFERQQRKVKKTKKEEKMKKQADAQPEQKDKKREKKVFDLPGQKRDPPEERDPLRIFYETLHQQLPNSEMAAFWMMESGLLPKDVATKIYQKKQKTKEQQKLGSPMKAVVTVTRDKCAKSITVKGKTPPSSNRKKMNESNDLSEQSKKRKVESDESDDDFVLSSRVKKRSRAA